MLTDIKLRNLKPQDKLYDLVKYKRTPRLSYIGQLIVFLEIVWTLVTKVGMKPTAVVEHHDVVDEVSPGFCPGLVVLPVHTL